MSDELREFLTLVDMMRQAQRAYFASTDKFRKLHALQQSKNLERLVDDEIARLKKAAALKVPA